MKTKICPRCKEQRLFGWFGDPKAPYAICLSCRVELNGPASKKRAEENENFGQGCAICGVLLTVQKLDICGPCEIAIKHLDTTKLLARAQSYIAGKLRQPRKPRKFKRQNKRLHRLISQQRADANDRNIRFDHAVNK